MCFGHKSKTTTKTKLKKENIKILARAGNGTRDILHPKRMRYLCTKKLTKSIDCSQAI